MGVPKPDASLHVNFILPEDEQPGEDPSLAPGADIWLELDRERNTEVYNMSKTRFAPGETAYLRMAHSGEGKATIQSSTGSIKRAGSGILFPIFEMVIFAMTDTGRLRQIPADGISWDWIGNSCGTPKFEGRRVTIPNPCVGVLRCEYDVSGSRLALSVKKSDMAGYDEISVVVVAHIAGSSASVTVTYAVHEPHEGGAPIPMDLEVSDFCSGESVEGVTVYLDGEGAGTTNATGRIHLGELVPGSNHTLKMTKDGYIDSDNDVLHNDSFTVPTA